MTLDQMHFFHYDMALSLGGQKIECESLKENTPQGVTLEGVWPCWKKCATVGVVFSLRSFSFKLPSV